MEATIEISSHDLFSSLCIVSIPRLEVRLVQKPVINDEKMNEPIKRAQMRRKFSIGQKYQIYYDVLIIPLLIPGFRINIIQ